MDIILNTVKVLWKLFWIAVNFCIDVAIDSEKPIYSAEEARRRKRNGTISPEEYYKATKKY